MNNCQIYVKDKITEKRKFIQFNLSQTLQKLQQQTNNNRI